MGFLFRSPTFTLVMFLFVLLFTLSSASDMSILSYDQDQGIESSWRSDEEVMTVYEEWIIEHRKFYNSLEEKEERFEIFKDNLRFIDEHNSGNWTYTVGLNQFSDLTDEEYQSMYLMPPQTTSPWEGIVEPSDDWYLDDSAVPASIDWRAKGAVTGVKDQGQCGSCYTFSAIAAVEGINKIVTGNLVSLSEQELLDCSSRRPYGNHGCKGGHSARCLQYIKDYRGLNLGSAYPYVAKQGSCRRNMNNRNGRIDGFKRVTINEKSLKMAVAKQPVSVAIDSKSRSFHSYKSGIYSGPCNDVTHNHAVTIVGYGTENGIDYWLVKNSWGQNWGENGYIRMKRNVVSRRGKCGIASNAIYPTKLR